MYKGRLTMISKEFSLPWPCMSYQQCGSQQHLKGQHAIWNRIRKRDTYSKSNTFSFEIYFFVSRTSHGNVRALQNLGAY